MGDPIDDYAEECDRIAAMQVRHWTALDEFRPL